MLKSTLSWFFPLSWTWSQELIFPSILCWHDGSESDAKNLKEVFQLQFGAGEGAGLEENLAAAQQQMQVMQQVIMMKMVIGDVVGVAGDGGDGERDILWK